MESSLWAKEDFVALYNIKEQRADDNDHHRRYCHDSLMWTQVPFDFHHGFVYSFVTSSLFVPFEILRNEFERENVNRKK